MSVVGLALWKLYPQTREVYRHWRLEANFPSFQAYMENTNTAHNHLYESHIFRKLSPVEHDFSVLLCCNGQRHMPRPKSKPFIAKS